MFYKEIILNWSEINEYPKVLTKESINNECIWLNNKITVKEQPLYNQNALENKLWYMSDVIKEDDNFHSHIEINAKFKTKCTFLDMLKIRLTTPQKWKNILQGKECETTSDATLYKKLLNVQKLKTKDIYELILENNHDCKTFPNSQIYWQTKYNIDNDLMQQFYRLPYRSTKRTNLQALQYKILHKIINCNFWLHKITIKDTPKCRFCSEDETIEHYFFGCKVTKSFWKAFQTWWNQFSQDEIDKLYEKDIILGYIRDINIYKVLNCCILIGKSTIYQQKSYDKHPDIYKFHCELKEFLEIESLIALNNNRLSVFNKEWGDILDI